MKKKLVEYQSINNMDEERMVKKVTQEADDWAKNIFTEIEIIMEELGINIIEVTKLNKKQWEQVIDKKINEKADEEARKDCYMKEKTRMIANEEREQKKYIWEQLKENGRTICEVRTNMIKKGANFGEKGKDLSCAEKKKQQNTSSNAAGHKTTSNQKDIRKTLKEREQVKEILKG